MEPGERRTLLLNVTYEPLCVISLRRAILLVIAGKATIEEQRSHRVYSQRLTFSAPSVVRLVHYVWIPYPVVRSVSRRGIMERDNYRCVYCGDKAHSLDHVIPRSRGGAHAWSNVVACCLSCNNRKADHLLSELGWKQPAIAAPIRPGRFEVHVLSCHEPSWEPYFALSA